MTTVQHETEKNVNLKFSSSIRSVRPWVESVPSQSSCCKLPAPCLMTCKLALFLCFSFTLSLSSAQRKHIQAAVILPVNNNRYHISLSRVLPLLKMAAKEVKSRRILSDLRFRFMPRDGGCNDQYAEFSAVETYYHDHVDVFFGPTCEYCVGKFIFCSWVHI